MNTFRMQQNLRWFGPGDTVPLIDIRQTGCEGVVTALHHIPVGEVWPIDEINDHKKLVEEAGLTWTVVESLPVHEDIKKRKGRYLFYIENYKSSMANLAACGISVVTYNFMPILDWLRTDVSYRLPGGSKALYFNRIDFAVFDLFLLRRPGAEQDYSKAELDLAKSRNTKMSMNEKQSLFNNCLLGLPGSDEPFTPKQILDALKEYDDIDAAKLKENLYLFLESIVPMAKSVGIKLAIHPDDPPYPIMGLPRVVSTENDLEELLNACPENNNGLCFCTGSLGARSDNDLVAMVKKFGDRIHFLHLRNTRRDLQGNFYEDNHLDGNTNMEAIVKEVLLLMQRQERRIPMRPDHGHQMLDDLTKRSYPGYSLIGRMKGLAELRGLEKGIASCLET